MSTPIALYKGDWPPPRLWGFSDGAIEAFKHRQRKSFVRLMFAGALVVFLGFIVPQHWLAYHPVWHSLILHDLGAVLPIIQVASLGNRSGFVPLLWSVNLLVVWGMLVPDVVGLSAFALRQCDYSLIRGILRGAPFGTGTGMWRLIEGFLVIAVVWLLGAIYVDVQGYILWIREGIPSLSIIAKGHFWPPGFLSGWGYRAPISYRQSGAGRFALILTLFLYDGMILGLAFFNAMFFVGLRHYKTARAATRADVEALDSLWKRTHSRSGK
ncbi:MAG: hypothetical protein ACYDEV_10675 [Acidiferrobacter sp.]